MNLEHVIESPYWNQWAAAYNASRNGTRFEEDHEFLQPSQMTVARDADHLVEMVTALDDRGEIRSHADGTAFAIRDVMVLKVGNSHLWEISKGGTLLEMISVDSYCGTQSATAEVISGERDFLRKKVEDALLWDKNS